MLFYRVFSIQPIYNKIVGNGASQNHFGAPLVYCKYRTIFFTGDQSLRC